MENKKLWVIFGGGDNCFTCESLITEMSNSKIISRKSNEYIFFKCDLTKHTNKILQYILLPGEIPNSYIFDEKGDLIYASARNESIYTIEQAIINVSNGKKYYSPQNQFLTVESDKLFRLHTLTLKSYIDYKNNDLSLAKIDSAINIEPYFYNLYLKSKILERKGETSLADSCKKIAENHRTSTFQKLVYVDLMKKIFIGTSSDDYAKIRIDSMPTDLKNIKYGEEKEIRIKVSNIGNKSLILYNVITNCSCNKISYIKTPIMPNEKTTINLLYNTSNRGDFKIKLVIHSNAINNLEKIELYGYIK